ncbi:MAG: DUF4330 family protein [Clostridia bacterium]|nr:DUF4330 family protein [Clostridia bacterium]
MKKRKFTWLDGALILILAVVLAVGGYILLREKPAELQAMEQDYLVTLRFNQVSEMENDGYAVGDTLYFQNCVEVLGTVQSIKEVDKVSERYDPAKGEYILVTDPEKKAIELQVLVHGKSESGKFSVANEEFFIGQTLYPQSDTTRSAMLVLNIEEVAA